MATEQPNYAPREGSVAWRVIEFLTTNPDESLSIDDVAVKFDASRASIHSLLAPAVLAGTLIRKEDYEDGELVYRLGSGVPGITAKPGRHPVLPRGGAHSPFGASAKPRNKPFWIDTSTVAVEKGIPLENRSPAGINWAALFGRMEPGDSFALPAAASSAVSKAMTDYQRANTETKLACRSTADGLRVWRLK